MQDEDESRPVDGIGNSRRSFLKTGALTSGAFALGVAAPGFASSQEDPDGDDGTATATPTTTPDGDGADGGKALMFNNEFRPNARFRVKSPVLERNPDVEGVQEGDIWSDYNTRVIEYLNTNEEVFFFPADDAEVQQGQVYELNREFSLFADDTADEGVISVSFEPVGEDDVLFDDDNQLEPGTDYGITAGGGKALVHVSNFAPNGLLRVTSDVVDWVPRPAVQGSDIFSEYNSRHAEFLNVNDEFLLYPAHAAEIDQGAVYVMRDEFDVTDPEGLLVTADLDRVNEDDLPDDLL